MRIIEITMKVAVPDDCPVLDVKYHADEAVGMWGKQLSPMYPLWDLEVLSTKTKLISGKLKPVQREPIINMEY